MDALHISFFLNYSLLENPIFFGAKRQKQKKSEAVTS